MFSDVLDENKIHISQSYDAIRKTCILLKFFDFWYRVKLQQSESYDEIRDNLPNVFREEIDYELKSCGYQPLFAGNPYDWIYLCSSHSSDPIAFFSEIVGVIEEKSFEDT